MKPNQQNTNQQNTNQQTDQQTGMGAPEAASKRDVQEAERKADEAREKADDAQKKSETAEERIEELRAENAELRQVVGKLVGAVRRIDEHLDHVDEDIGAWGNGYKTESISELFELPEPNTHIEDMGGDESPTVTADGDEVAAPDGDVSAQTDRNEVSIPYKDEDE